jgi:hypothetical protein
MRWSKSFGAVLCASAVLASGAVAQPAASSPSARTDRHPLLGKFNSRAYSVALFVKLAELTNERDAENWLLSVQPAEYEKWTCSERVFAANASIVSLLSNRDRAELMSWEAEVRMSVNKVSKKQKEEVHAAVKRGSADGLDPGLKPYFDVLHITTPLIEKLTADIDEAALVWKELAKEGCAERTYKEEELPDRLRQVHIGPIRARELSAELDAQLSSPSDEVRVVSVPRTGTATTLQVAAIIPPRSWATQAIPVCVEDHRRILGYFQITDEGDLVKDAWNPIDKVVPAQDGKDRPSCWSYINTYKRDMKAASAAK